MHGQPPRPDDAPVLVDATGDGGGDRNRRGRNRKRGKGGRGNGDGQPQGQPHQQQHQGRQGGRQHNNNWKDRNRNNQQQNRNVRRVRPPGREDTEIAHARRDERLRHEGNWWADRWLGVLHRFGWKNRLANGRMYADEGRVTGFTVETGTQAVRLVLSGVFDKYPKLKIIVGHLGEGLPFLLWRIDSAFGRPENAKTAFRDAFSEHFYLTTSGNFSDPALLCSVQELGADRILFAVDWPFVENKDGVAWMQQVPLCAEDRAKILSGNARRLLKI